MNVSTTVLTPAFDYVETQITVGITAVQLVKPRADRVTVMFSAHPQQAYFISTKSTISAPNGINLNAGVLPITFKFADYGALVGSAWYGITSSSSAFITVMEVFFHPERLATSGG